MMLPKFQIPIPKKPKNVIEHKLDIKSFLASFGFTSWILLLTIILLQLSIIFTSTCSAPRPTSIHRLRTTANNVSSARNVTEDPCPSGRVYVYDLPPMFNKYLLEKCDVLDARHSLCDNVLNGGFGRRAPELARVVPESVAPAWYWSEQYMLEPVIHNRVLEHKCRTLEPESATAFYIPFYAALSVGRYLWSHNYTVDERDKDCKIVIKWVQDQPYWKRSNGWDHFITLGRVSWDFRQSRDDQWGSNFINMPGMNNITRLLLERNPWDHFDVGVPFPTGFHPRSDADVINWQNFVRAHERTSLFCFTGGTRDSFKNDFRSILLSYCANESDSCLLVKCSRNRCARGDPAVLETLLSSDFCLQPRGDSYSRKSVFDCILAGSIPVFFWERMTYKQQEWFFPGEPGSYSVFIDHKEVENGKSIREVLEKYSKDEVTKMREKVIETIPKIVYASPPEGLEHIRDAFDIALDGILKRFKKQQPISRI